MRQIIIQLLCIIIGGMALPSCYHGMEAVVIYGRTANSDRARRGIPAIPNDWIETASATYASWGNPLAADPTTTRQKMHRYKETSVDKKTGEPLEETDWYRTGKKFQSRFDEPGVLADEELAITYDFTAARAGKKPWHAKITCGPHATEADNPDKLTLAQAEAILKDWGIPR